jgi:opacity protein-like surface antigen
MRKRSAAFAASSFCVLPAAMAQQTQPQAPAQQTPPTQSQPPAPAPARPGYYQFPQAAPAQQYPQYYQYPQTPPPPSPPPPHAAPTPVSSEPLVHWHIDGGWSDPAGKTADYLQGGYSAGVGFSVAPARGSPFDLRFDFNYDRNDATQRLIGINQNSSGAVNRGREEVWNGTLDLEMHVPIGTSGVDAYFFGGGGAYNVTLSFGEPFYAAGGNSGGYYYCDPFEDFCGGGFGEVRTSSHTMTKFGWNAGAGLEGPINPGVKWFVEGRYNRVQLSNNMVPLAFIPVTVGLRF